MSELKFYLFGPPRLERNGVPLKLGRRKATALLAYVALMHRCHSREALTALFWPEYDQRRGRTDLSRTLSVLNKTLESGQLVVNRETVAINLQGNLWVDVLHFQELLGDCNSHGHPETEACSTCLPLLTKAVILYQADFLAGFSLPNSAQFDEWQFFQTESLRRSLLSALERLSRGHSSHGKYELASSYARRWLELDPLNELAHQQLMLIYAWAGQQTASLRQYETYVRVLEQELGVPPSEETTELYEAIKDKQMPTLPVVKLNDHIDSSQSTLLPTFLEEEEASATAKHAIFVARTHELGQLNNYLDAALEGHGRVVFVTGEAGRGKTTLLQEFARRAQEAHKALAVGNGNCNALFGKGDPYVPFRDIMDMLSGNVESKCAAGAITQEHARRLWRLLPHTLQALVDDSPDLIDVFVSGASLTRNAAISSTQTERLLHALKQLRGWQYSQSGHLEQHQLFEQYTQVLHKLATHSPLLLLLDDLQWADGASISLLFHLGRRLPGSRILIIGAYRPSEVASDPPLVNADQTRQHPLGTVANELKRQFGEIQVDLGRPAPAEGRQFVEDLLDSEPNQLDKGFRKALFGRTAGHPLFTSEMLRDMQERGDLVQDAQGRWIEAQEIDWNALPARTEAVIKQRVGRLDDELRDILSVASVEGEAFTAQVIAHVRNIDEWPLLRRLSQELEHQHRLVQERGELKVGRQRLSRYQFGHALFQQYLYNRLSFAERRLLHGEIAQALEEMYESHTAEIATQLTYHWIEAGERERAIESAQQAANRAVALYAYEEAAQYLHTALDLIEPGTQPEKRLAILEQLADAYAALGERSRAIQLYQEALDLWLSLANRDKMVAVRMHRKIGEMVVYMTSFSDRQQFEATAQTSLETGLKLVEGEPPHSETVRLLVTFSTKAYYVQIPEDWDAAEHYAREAVTIAEELDRPVELSVALDALASVYGGRDLFRKRVEVSLRRLALSREPSFSNVHERARILQQTGFALIQVGEYSEAMPYLLEAERLSGQIQALDHHFLALRYQAYAWFRLDQWDNVLKINEKWTALAQRYPNFVELARATCFNIALNSSVYALRGSIERADSLREEAMAVMVAHSGPVEGWGQANRY